MPKTKKDTAFDIQFFESVLRRYGRDVRALTQLGHLYTAEGRIDDGLAVDRRLARLCPDDPLVHYNLACSLSLKRLKPQAMRSLRKAVELGYDDPDFLYQDSDLACLHSLKSFRTLLDQLKSSSTCAHLKNGYFLS